MEPADWQGVNTGAVAVFRKSGILSIAIGRRFLLPHAILDPNSTPGGGAPASGQVGYGGIGFNRRKFGNAPILNTTYRQIP